MYIIIYNIVRFSNITRREPEYGYTVVFHHHESYSSTIPSGFWMSPGSIYKVDLSMTKVRHQELVLPLIFLLHLYTDFILCGVKTTEYEHN